MTIYNSYPFTMSKLLTEGKIGNFELKKEIVLPGTILHMYNRQAGKLFKGEYSFSYPVIKLKEEGNTWMSDTQLEIESVVGAMEAAYGNMLIAGLGIGLLPTMIKAKTEVKSIDIVEFSREVIDLVFHQISTPKMAIIKDDIYHYLTTTDKRYDFIHIDIWNGITAPIREIDRARNAASRCLKPNGIIWCWLQELYDNIKSRLPKKPLSRSERGSPAIYEPCLICGKTLRFDYAGLCMDCADDMRLSEFYTGSK